MQPKLGLLTGGSAGGDSAYLNSRPAAQKKTGGGILSVLPTVLAAGASFVPGVGTAGAAAFGGIGEYFRQRMAGEDTDVKRIGTEALLSAVPGGLGKAGKIFKGIRNLDKGAQVARAGATPTNALGRFAGKLEGNSRGINPGAKVAGQDPLGVDDAAELNAHMSGQGIRGGSAAKQLEQLERTKAARGQQIGSLIEGGNKELGPDGLAAVSAKVQANLGKLKGLPKAKGTPAFLGADGKALVRSGGGGVSHPYADDLMADLGNVKDVKGLQDFKVKLDQDAINYGRSSAGADPQKEQIAKAFRTALSDSVGEAVPGVRGAQKAYSLDSRAESYLQKAAANPKGMTFPFVGQNANLGGEALQGGLSKSGAMLSKLSGSGPTGARIADELANPIPPAAAGGGIRGLLGGLGGQTATRLAVPGSGGVPDPQQPTTPTGAEGAMEDPGLDSAPLDAAAGVSDNAFSPEVLQRLALNDIASTGGKNLAQIKMLKDLFGDTANNKPLSAEGSKQVANAKSGMEAIKQLRDEIAGGVSPTTNSIAGLGGNLGRGLAGTQGYDAARQEVIDVLARLRTGAAITKTEEERFKRALPSAFDSPDVQEQKLARYDALFDRILQNQQQGSPDLEVAGAKL